MIFSYYYDFLLFNGFSHLSIMRNFFYINNEKPGIFPILVMGRIHFFEDSEPNTCGVEYEAIQALFLHGPRPTLHTKKKRWPHPTEAQTRRRYMLTMAEAPL